MYCSFICTVKCEDVLKRMQLETTESEATHPVVKCLIAKNAIIKSTFVIFSRVHIFMFHTDITLKFKMTKVYQRPQET